MEKEGQLTFIYIIKIVKLRGRFRRSLGKKVFFFSSSKGIPKINMYIYPWREGRSGADTHNEVMHPPDRFNKPTLWIFF